MSPEEQNQNNSLAETSPQSTEQVVELWMTTLGQLYNRENSEVVLLVYQDALKECQPRTLDAAFRLVLTRTKFFPTVAEILDCCDEVYHINRWEKGYYKPEDDDRMTDDEMKEFAQMIRAAAEAAKKKTPAQIRADYIKKWGKP